jgi:hypothetical protein
MYHFFNVKTKTSIIIARIMIKTEINMIFLRRAELLKKIDMQNVNEIFVNKTNSNVTYTVV